MNVFPQYPSPLRIADLLGRPTRSPIQISHYLGYRTTLALTVVAALMGTEEAPHSKARGQLRIPRTSVTGPCMTSWMSCSGNVNTAITRSRSRDRKSELAPESQRNFLELHTGRWMDQLQNLRNTVERQRQKIPSLGLRRFRKRSEDGTWRRRLLE